MKTIISVECVDQDLIITNSPLIASGGLNENRVAFKFCSKWDGFAKTAVFYKNTKEVYHALVDENNMCEVPHEVTDSEGTMFFGVFGVSGDVTRTSKVLKYKIRQGAITGDTSPSDPTPDIYEQILSQYAFIIEEHTDLQNAIEMAQSTADTATAIAKGRNQAHVFSTTADMAAWLSDANNKGLWQRGDNIYIVELDVPDWWIAEVLDEADAETGYYYKLGQLETQKIDLVNLEADIANIQNTYQTKDKIFTTYKSLEALGTSADNITTLNGLVPWASQLNLCVNAIDKDTLYAKGIIPEQSMGTLTVINYGLRGYARFVTDGGSEYIAYTSNCDSATFNWIDNTARNYAQFKTLTMPDYTYTIRSYLEYLRDTVKEPVITYTPLYYFKDVSAFCATFDASFRTAGFAEIVFIPDQFFKVAVSGSWSTWRYNNVLWCIGTPTELDTVTPTDAELYASFKPIAWKSEVKNGTTIWTNSSPVAMDTLTVNLDLSGYTEVEVVYAEALKDGVPHFIKRTGRLPIKSYTLYQYLEASFDNGDVGGAYREYRVYSGSNGGLTFDNGFTVNADGDKTDKTSVCIPLEIVAY